LRVLKGAQSLWGKGFRGLATCGGVWGHGVDLGDWSLSVLEVLVGGEGR
jgi:hypothetical protein